MLKYLCKTYTKFDIVTLIYYFVNVTSLNIILKILVNSNVIFNREQLKVNIKTKYIRQKKHTYGKQNNQSANQNNKSNQR